MNRLGGPCLVGLLDDALDWSHPDPGIGGWPPVAETGIGRVRRDAIHITPARASRRPSPPARIITRTLHGFGLTLLSFGRTYRVRQGQGTAAAHRVISARHGNPLTGYTVIATVLKDDPHLEDHEVVELK